MNDLVDIAKIEIPPRIQQGVDALRDYLGAAGDTILSPAKLKKDELACFEVILPTDYLGVDRVLRIGFRKSFPDLGLRLTLQPSPEMDWPHTLYETICLFGVGQNPPYGNSRAVVISTMQRFSKLLSIVLPEGNVNERTKEFESEISNYWKNQLKFAPQQLILLNIPKSSQPLRVLGDHRWRPNKKEQYIWLSSEVAQLQSHLAKLTSIKTKIKYPAEAAFFLPLVTLPDRKIPLAVNLFNWLSSHITHDDERSLIEWWNESANYPIRWILLKLPGDELAIQSIILRNNGVKEQSNVHYGLRAGKRSFSGLNSKIQARLQYAPVHVISPETIYSRNPQFKTRDLYTKKVLMVGLGSLGSKVTTELVKEGVSQVHLLDYDYLSDANLGRHVLGVDDLGRRKVAALQEHIRANLPLIKINADEKSLQSKLEETPSFLDQFDLIINTTSDPWAENLLWILKEQGAKWTLIQGWSEPYAFVGHVLSIPAEVNLSGEYLFDASGNFKHSFTKFADHGIIPLLGCGAGYLPGGPLGIAHIATMIADTALSCLVGSQTEPEWRSWVGNDPTTTAKSYMGEYIGPSIPTGMISGVFKQSWPIKPD